MPATIERTQRRYDLDWLRVLAILTVFAYHSARFFDLEFWHIKNASTYLLAQAWTTVLGGWMMPLIFVISGASVYYAIGKGGAGKFMWDKVLRLGVPLIVGAFTHASLQVYLERLTHGDFSGTYFQFLPYYFQGHYEGGNPAAGNFALTGMHLWYLAWLFAFTLILYPLMRWLVGRGKGVLGWLGNALSQPGAVFVLVLPILLGSMDNEDDSFLLWWEAGWPLLVYLWLLLCGFVLASSEKLLDRIQSMRWISLGLAFGSIAASALVAFLGEFPAYGSAQYMLALGLRGLSGWCWVLAFLGLGRQYLTRSTPFVRYANEAVLPFYILHQTVILGIGYFVVQWPIPSLLKWVIIFVIALAIVMALYEVVRRVNVLRVLFGMKWRKKAPAA